VNRGTAIKFLDSLHEAQNEFYAGGSGADLHQILAPNITWTVPGDQRPLSRSRGRTRLLPTTPRRCRSHLFG
jgi:hypothetical protein